MDKTHSKSDDTSPEDDGIWRRAELSDLPKLKEMITAQSRKTFVFSDVARLITNNPLSLCRVDSNGEIPLFLSVSSRPVINCVAHGHWTEWFNYFYDLPEVQECNTVFVHLILFRSVEHLIHMPTMLDTVYVEMPDVNNVVLMKLPGARFCAEMCLPFSVLPATHVTADPEFGRPEILYHTRATIVRSVHLRIAELDDFDDLRAALGNRLDSLDEFYGDDCLADLLRFPGNGRVNLVPAIGMNGLAVVTTDVNYSLLDRVFDLRRYTGLVEPNYDWTNIMLRLPDVSERMENVETANGLMGDYFNVDEQYEAKTFSYEGLDGEIEILSPQSNSVTQGQSSLSVTLKSEDSNTSSTDEGNLIFKKSCDASLNYVIKNFLMFQEKPIESKNDIFYSNSLNEPSLNTVHNEFNYQKTAFMVELMLIDDDDEKKASWDYFVDYFRRFSEYAYCLMTLQTIATPPLYKNVFCKVSLKPNCHYHMGQLYLLHRSFLFGKFTCVMVTKDHLEIMEHLIENHPNKPVISDNISKSVFEDTRYRTYMFKCDDQPIGYCVLRLNDEMKRLNGHFDVARYLYTILAHNHMADLLNMDIQEIFVKKIRSLLRYVMEDSNVNCLFYRIYSDSTTMEQHGTTCITGTRELIPVKPRARMQNDDENVPGDCEKFALLHMNARLCTTRIMSIDAKIVVIGGSVGALSFIENLVFNPVNYCISFENIVLISDNGIPYQVSLSDLEQCMVPKTAHFDHEYMQSIALHQHVDTITGTVTGINKVDKFVIVNENDLIYYDYLFLFNGEQFKFSVDGEKIKSDKKRNMNSSKNAFSIKSSNDNEALENVFLLNSENDITHAFNYIEIMKNSDGDIVVYGKYLGSLSVINVLLESNIDGSRIVYMESDINSNLPFIASRSITNKVYDELHRQGVRVHKQCNLDKVKLNKNHTKVKKVSFTSDVGLLTIDCAGLFWFDQKKVNEVSRHMLIQSSFKFDGRVMVNASFETNVESVFAAGPAAVFVSGCSGDDDDLSAAPCSHTRYSSTEVGARVADVLMRRLDVVAADGRTDGKYVRPLYVRCRLPGRHGYFHSAVPGMRHASEELSGETLWTENAVGGYFEMVVDGRGDVLELSCYSSRNFEYLNLINLCGKNVNLFNDLLDRLSTNSVPCLFDYFRESWAYPLYSERFWKLLDDTIMNRVKKNDKDVKTFLKDNVDVLMAKYNAYTVTELSARAGLDGRFDEIYGEKLRKTLIAFIDENIDDFEVFSHVRDAVDQTHVHYKH